MKDYKNDKRYDETPLDDEERQIMADIDAGKYKSVPNVEEEKKR